MLKISTTSKLDGIRSWSLQALETCPASVNGDGTLVDACKGCYATTNFYLMASVKAPRESNKLDWQRIDWCDDMVKALDSDRYFRWFDSGDMYSLALAEKILEVMVRTPWVKHWLPTRMLKFPKYRGVIAKMMALDNVMVRFSSDSVTGEYTSSHGSVIIPTSDDATDSMALCRAYEHGGKCSGCRQCWDKEVPLIAYPAHGKKMLKVIKIKQV